MTGGTNKFDPIPSFANEASRTYFDNASAPRVNTDIVIVEALRRQYPQLHLTVVPQSTCQLLNFAADGNAATSPIDSEKERLIWRSYIPTPRRIDGYQDGLADVVQFGKFLLEYKNREFIVFVVNGRDGSSYYPQVVNQYVLSSSVDATNQLLIEAGRWTNTLHNEVFVFDRGYWQKSAELYESVMSAEWSNVILPEEQKNAIINDVDYFFNNRDTYKSLKVPWKRGVIYYGPPGNGKTISIKAMMHALYQRKDPVPTLYVRTLASYAGPEAALNSIFSQARRYAPCYLIFEDLDTIITPNVRSYFFNEVDGLKSNDGIFMVGSTNHLDQLDPGISKRPSRFDRKYLFPDPDREQRKQYAAFWQRKLKDNKDIEFPDSLCDAIAGITDGFSFAYMQEAFVASLLAIAGRKDTKAFADVTDESQPTHSPQSGLDKLSSAVTKRSYRYKIVLDSDADECDQECLKLMLEMFEVPEPIRRDETDMVWSMDLTRSQLKKLSQHRARPNVSAGVHDVNANLHHYYELCPQKDGSDLLQWKFRDGDAHWTVFCEYLQRYDTSVALFSEGRDEDYAREVHMTALQACRAVHQTGCKRMYHISGNENIPMKHVSDDYFTKVWEGSFDAVALWRVEGKNYESKKILRKLIAENDDTKSNHGVHDRVGHRDSDRGDDHKKLDDLVLWKEMKKQVKILKEEIRND